MEKIIKGADLTDYHSEKSRINEVRIIYKHELGEIPLIDDVTIRGTWNEEAYYSELYKICVEFDRNSVDLTKPCEPGLVTVYPDSVVITIGNVIEEKSELEQKNAEYIAKITAIREKLRGDLIRHKAIFMQKLDDSVKMAIADIDEEIKKSEQIFNELFTK
jgi:hypothetical protein